MITLRDRTVLLAISGLIAPLVMALNAEDKSTDKGHSFAHIVIDSNEVQLGQPFEIVLLVEAIEGLVKADFSALVDFSTRFVSSKPRLSARGVRYELHYVFVAKRSGKLQLPAIEVSVGNEMLATQEVVLRVLEPEQTDALGLDISLSKEQCYVGEALEVTVTWRISVDPSRVKGVDLTIPILNDKRFDVFDRALAIDPSSKGAVGMPVGNRRVIAKGSTHKIGASEFSTLTFTKVLVPRQTGIIEIEKGSVYCTIEADQTTHQRQRNQYPSYFNNDFFERDVEGKYKRYYAVSEVSRLEVKELPERGRPAGFYGLVSAGIEVSVNAKSLQVEVGTPMTIEVRMRARECIENLELRPLYKQPALAVDFAIPRQRSPFVYDKGAKVFTQSLRPLRGDVETIGIIKVPYFDTDMGEYRVARSRPVAIEVIGNGAQTVTGIAGPDKRKEDNWQPAIHIVEIAIVFVVGVGVGMGLFAAAARKRQTGKSRSPDTNAHAEFKRAMAGIPVSEDGEGNVHEAVYTALRAYLGATLGITPHTRVCSDATRRLGSLGVDALMLERLEQVFYECEVWRFGKCYTNDSGLDNAVLKEFAVTCTEDIDRCLDPSRAQP